MVKERTSSHKLSSDLHMKALVYPYLHTHICTYAQKTTSFLKVKEEKSRNKILSTRERIYNLQGIFISNDWHMTKKAKGKDNRT